MSYTKDNDKVEIDTLVHKAAWFGVPGFVLFFVITMVGGIQGLFGGAAIMVALDILGGPFGVIVGIGMLLFLSKNAKKITKYGAKKILPLILTKLLELNNNKTEIIKKIESYPISHDLKMDIINYIKNHNSSPD